MADHDRSRTNERLYVGTHRRAHHTDVADTAFGIYVFDIASDGDLWAAGLIETLQPGWVAAHPDGKALYAANEVRAIGDAPGGAISAFATGDDGEFRLLGTHATPAMPCHCTVDADGRFLALATFGGGTVHLFELADDGSIARETDRHEHRGSSVHPRRQTSPHAHGVTFDPSNRFLLVPDLGTDTLYVYEFLPDEARLLARPDRSVSLAPGSGPRHVCFDRTGRFVYLINEMTATIAVFAFDAASGALDPIEIHPLLPEDFAGLRSGGEVGIRPDGRFLYATTRSHGSSGMPAAPGRDTLIWFAIDEATGRLRPAGTIASGGAIPRSFAFNRAGDMLYVGHQCTGSIGAFRLDAATGEPVLAATTVTPVPVALCMT